MSEDDEDLLEEKYQEGFDTGYASAQKETIKEYEDKIEDIQNEHEKALKVSYIDGYNEAEDRYGRELNNVSYNISVMIEQYQNTIQDLRRQNYDLRKENAAITRSIQKST